VQACHFPAWNSTIDGIFPSILQFFCSIPRIKGISPLIASLPLSGVELVMKNNERNTANTNYDDPTNFV
jgi:hypothetical protein